MLPSASSSRRLLSRRDRPKSGVTLAITGAPDICAGGVHADHLSGLRRLQSQLARQRIDSFGIAQRRLFQPQCVIDFQSCLALDLQRFDLVAVLDGLEMLPGVSHDQQEQAAERDAELSSSRGRGVGLPPSPGASCRWPWRSRFPACPSSRAYAAGHRCRLAAAAAAIYATPSRFVFELCHVHAAADALPVLESCGFTCVRGAVFGCARRSPSVRQSNCLCTLLSSSSRLLPQSHWIPA